MLEIKETRRNAMLKIKDVVFTLAGAALLLASSRALAVDGVVEINEAKVMAAGGFPYTISSSGSYRLTSNLMPLGGADGIHVDSGDVTLDLNGFTISQGGIGGTGIQANSGKNAVTVRNGLVSGFANGILLNDISRIEAVQALSNSSIGIQCADDCHVEHCTAKANGANGIS